MGTAAVQVFDVHMGIIVHFLGEGEPGLVDPPSYRKCRRDIWRVANVTIATVE